MEIKRQLDATDDIYCRFYCMLNMFRTILCPSSGAREYYTDGRCLQLLMMGIVLSETCWACNKICNKYHLLHLVGVLFPHINDDAGQNHFKFTRNTVHLFGVNGDILALRSRHSTRPLGVEIHSLYVLPDVICFHFWQFTWHLPGCDIATRVFIFTVR